MALGSVLKGAIGKFATSLKEKGVRQTMSSAQKSAANRVQAFKTNFNEMKNRSFQRQGTGTPSSLIKAFNIESMKRERGFQAAKVSVKMGVSASKWTGRKLGSVGASTAKRVGRLATKVGKRVSTPGVFLLGATAMFGINFMKGGMNETRDIVAERYMQDYTYSKSMLHNSRVGLASGTNSMLNNGGTQGLSLALSKTRHGRF